MKRKYFMTAATALSIAAMVCISCEFVDIEKKNFPNDYVDLSDVAQLMAALPLEKEQLKEVYDAVNASSANGYDEEYTLTRLFENPGSGVGDGQTTKAAGRYGTPLKSMIEEHLKGLVETKAANSGCESCYLAVLRDLGVDGFMRVLSDSDMQIYWPYSGSWNGEDFPVVTFDPESKAEKNVGYKLTVDADGHRGVEEVIVDEALAKDTPVWVINRNSDAGAKTLEMLRREDPDWGSGGTIVVRPASLRFRTKAPEAEKSKCLILEKFKAKSHFESWFAGASEFYVKTGYVEDFTATTEAEMRLYNPAITDFLVVVKRGELNKEIDCSAMLISDWTTQMESCAFMIVEDDGGTQKSWDCSAIVKIASKSYGFDISIPLNSRDDIVWRGQLSNKWLAAHSEVLGHFGEVDLTFRVEEY
ncbi:MAG: hypothetical protein ACI3ZQ_09710 [Candidatus Cryptobacteroides sp.]